MRTMIYENQRGLLFKNGKFEKCLGPGKYRAGRRTEIEVLPLQHPIGSEMASIDVLLQDEALQGQVVSLDVKPRQVALHFVNGHFAELLSQGRHAFWKDCGEHTFQLTDISEPEVGEEIPRYIFGKISSRYYTRVEVAEYQKARLFYDGKLERILEPGVYYFWRGEKNVTADLVDIRLTQMNITGQEILTQDKVALRINVVLNYRIADYVKSFREIGDFREQIHVVAQLALREYVGRYKMDEILENKEDMSRYVAERLQAKQTELYVEILDAGVKDIILPGDVRDIMNTVLLAEKKAQANVIARREEVASTRSLLNTAKLMDENKTLYKLKELEYIERICENVGNINLNGNGDVLTQLAALLRKDE